MSNVAFYNTYKSAVFGPLETRRSLTPLVSKSCLSKCITQENQGLSDFEKKTYRDLFSFIRSNNRNAVSNFVSVTMDSDLESLSHLQMIHMITARKLSLQNDKLMSQAAVPMNPLVQLLQN